ncbi:MAG: TatD family hydrolase [Candidatus Paceibacterota bacterium]
MTYFDSHTHLNLPEFDKDREEIIKKTSKEGLTLINVGTRFETSLLALKLAKENKNMLATVGLHPTYASGSFDGEKEDFQIEKYLELTKEKEIVAIGECGLDYYHVSEKEAKEKQKQIFKEHIDLAIKTGLPLMIHCRPSKNKEDERGYSQDAYEDILEIIEPHKKNIPGIIIHFFVGNEETTKKFIDIGCYFTFGGVITFTKVYDGVIKSIPLEKILLETDAPYVAPIPYRGKRNEPIFVKEIYRKMAEIRGISLDDLIIQLEENNKKIFKIN